MGVTVNVNAAGHADAFIPSGNKYPYCIWLDAATNVTVTTADGSNPRIDLIVAYVDLSVVSSASSNNPNAWSLLCVAGTPAGSPAVPNAAAIQAALPNSSYPYIVLARVAVAAGATTITNANITDVRVLTSSTPNKCRVYRATDTAVSSSATWTSIPFVIEDFDTATMHDTGSNTSRITIPAGGDGYYHVIGQINFAPNATGERGIKVKKNGAASSRTGGDFRLNNGAGAPTIMRVNTLIYLIAGDYVELQAYQASGGSLNAQANTSEYEFGTYFEVVQAS
jgi:hypothetical protein